MVTLGLAASASESHADGWYFTEGMGQSELNGELSDYFEGGDLAGRVSLGRRGHTWSVEANFMATGLEGRRVFAGNSYSALTIGLDAKYHVPLGTSGLGVYLRGGLNKMNLDGSWGNFDELRGDEYEGRGITYGAGVQIKGKIPAVGFLFWPLFFTDIGPKITGALWLDTSRQFVRLHHPNGPSLDGDFSTWTLGFAIGSDF
jgi:hypothetical protein